MSDDASQHDAGPGGHPAPPPPPALAKTVPPPSRAPARMGPPPPPPLVGGAAAGPLGSPDGGAADREGDARTVRGEHPTTEIGPAEVEAAVEQAWTEGVTLQPAPPQAAAPSEGAAPAGAPPESEADDERASAAGPLTPSPQQERLAFRSVPTADNMIGRVLQGRFRLEERIGSGGMSTVYRGLQLSVDRPVAVKVMHGEGVSDVQVRRFLREARAASMLRSRHTITIIDSGNTDDDIYYLVMELLRGRCLDKVMEDGALVPSRAVRIAREIALSLREAHGLGIIHRDLKPENVSLEPDADLGEIAKVLDFGIAKWHREGVSALTMAGSIYGTPRYMSPEQCQSLPLDLRSDLYALGVLLYEMLSGRAPFDSANPTGLVLAHVTKEPPDLGELVPSLPVALVRLVHRLLAKRPADRYASVDELVQAIDRLRMPGVAAGGGGLSGPQPLPDLRSPFESAEPRRPPAAAPAPLPPTGPLPVPPPVQRGSAPRASISSSSGRVARPQRAAWPFLVLPAVLTLLLGAGAVVWGSGRLSSLPPPPAGLRDLVARLAGAGAPTPDVGPPDAGSPRAPDVGAPASKRDAGPRGVASKPGSLGEELVVHIQLRSQPATVFAVVNRASVRETPVTLELLRGKRPIHVVFRKPGYRSQERRIVPDRDRELQVVLKPLKKQRRRR